MMKLIDWFRERKKRREAKKQEKLDRQHGMEAESLQLDVDPSQIDPPETRYTEEYQAFLKEQEEAHAEKKVEE